MIKREELKRLREGKDLTQAQLAEIVECSQQAIGAMEVGRQKQSGYIFAIAKALEVPLSDLETEVLPIEGLLYFAAEKLQHIDTKTAERFLKRFIETVSDFQVTTDLHVKKIAHFPERLKAVQKRRRPKKEQ